MFKEFALIVVGFLILLIIFKWLYNWKNTFFQYALVGLLLFSVILNIGYNIKYIIPNYYYENVSIGDCQENLFAYKDDSEFQWQILFPILKGRKVYLDDTDSDYEKFFKIFAKDVEKMTIKSSTFERILSGKENATTNISMTLIELLNYAFEPYDSTRYEDSYPFLRVYVESLEDDDELVAIIDANKNIYLMSKSYYDAKGTE